MTDPAHRLTNVARRQDFANSRPRDAATLIIVDRSGTEPRILMGRRHDGHKFMPGKFVFPGGRVDRADARLAVTGGLNPAVASKLLMDMKGKASEARARALALAAVRETFEEAGLLVGKVSKERRSSRSPLWRPFLDHNVAPRLDRLLFIARAITPPRRPRRFDTRFFCADASEIAAQVHEGDGELLDRHWLTLTAAKKLDLPVITHVIVEELERRLADPAGGDPAYPVPYYYMVHGRFRREEL